MLGKRFNGFSKEYLIDSFMAIAACKYAITHNMSPSKLFLPDDDYRGPSVGFKFLKKNKKIPVELDGLINRNMKRYLGNDVGLKVSEYISQYRNNIPALIKLSIAALGSPQVALNSVINHSRKFNNYIEYLDVKVDHSTAVIKARPISKNLHIETDCKYEEGFYKMLPTFYGLDPAVVDQTTCIEKGDPFCTYVINWNNKNSLRTYADSIRNVFFGDKYEDLREKASLVTNFDPDETGEHMASVGNITGIITEAILRERGFSESQIRKEVDRAVIAGTLHDIGKMGIDYDVLKKPGKLTQAEFEEIKRHPIVGLDYIPDIRGNETFRDAAACHHERFDGKGYPNNLAGDKIPLIGRVVAIADTYHAMLKPRCYKKALSKEEVLKIMISDEGHYDPYPMKIFLSSEISDKLK